VKDTDKAVCEIARVLKSDGTVIVGFPTVGLILDKLFYILGQYNIKDHHVSDHDEILGSFRKIMRVEDVRKFPSCLPMYMTLYIACKCSKI
jgi:hypothetical protein